MSGPDSFLVRESFAGVDPYPMYVQEWAGPEADATILGRVEAWLLDRASGA